MLLVFLALAMTLLLRIGPLNPRQRLGSLVWDDSGGCCVELSWTRRLVAAVGSGYANVLLTALLVRLFP